MRICCLGFMLISVLFVSGIAAQPEHRIGVGAHYWKTLDEIDLDRIDEDGLAWTLTYQYFTGALLKFQFDVEFLPEWYAASPERVTAPQVYALAGRSIYGGVGIGTYYSDGEYSQGPFFVFRVGYDMELVPSLHADIYANYRFDDWDMSEVEDDIDTDTVTIGAAVRFSL